MMMTFILETKFIVVADCTFHRWLYPTSVSVTLPVPPVKKWILCSPPLRMGRTVTASSQQSILAMMLGD